MAGNWASSVIACRIRGCTLPLFEDILPISLPVPGRIDTTRWLEADQERLCRCYCDASGIRRGTGCGELSNGKMVQVGSFFPRKDNVSNRPSRHRSQIAGGG